MICKHLLRFTNCYGHLSVTGECELTGERCDPIGAMSCPRLQREREQD